MDRIRDYHRSHTRSLLPAPPGIVAAYVFEGELSTEPVIAFALRDSWRSPLFDHPFTRDRDYDHSEDVVAMTLDSDGFPGLDAIDAENCVGIFHADELTDVLRAELINEYMAAEARRKLVREQQKAQQLENAAP